MVILTTGRELRGASHVRDGGTAGGTWNSAGVGPTQVCE